MMAVVSSPGASAERRNGQTRCRRHRRIRMLAAPEALRQPYPAAFRLKTIPEADTLVTPCRAANQESRRPGRCASTVRQIVRCRRSNDRGSDRREPSCNRRGRSCDTGSGSQRPGRSRDDCARLGLWHPARPFGWDNWTTNWTPRRTPCLKLSSWQPPARRWVEP